MKIISSVLVRAFKKCTIKINLSVLVSAFENYNGNNFKCTGKGFKTCTMKIISSVMYYPSRNERTLSPRSYVLLLVYIYIYIYIYIYCIYCQERAAEGAGQCDGAHQLQQQPTVGSILVVAPALLQTAVVRTSPLRTIQLEREREMFYLMTHSTHFIYGYMASDIWLRTIQIAREETRCRHMGYSFRLAARVFYKHHPTDRITHTTAFVTPVVEHWLEREPWRRIQEFHYKM